MRRSQGEANAPDVQFSPRRSGVFLARMHAHRRQIPARSEDNPTVHLETVQ